jgi:hypothetical protein
MTGGRPARPVTLIKYPTIHSNDHIPASIIKPDYLNGPWIAGGAAMAWYQNNPVQGDIDVFCNNKEQAEKLIDYIENSIDMRPMNGSIQIIFKTENATTFDVSICDQNYRLVSIWKIQIITCKYFDTIQDVINGFDLTVCQVATAGNEWVLGEKTAKDLRERNLRFIHITSDSPKRLTKYWCYGYRPVPGTLDAIKAIPLTDWSYHGQEDYNNVF